MAVAVLPWNLDLEEHIVVISLFWEMGEATTLFSVFCLLGGREGEGLIILIKEIERKGED